MLRKTLAPLIGGALFLTVATQLRPPGFPVGAGEAALLLLAMAWLVRFVAAPVALFDDPHAALVRGGLLLGAAALAFGALWGVLEGEGQISWHTAAAYCFAVLVFVSVLGLTRMKAFDGVGLIRTIAVVAVWGTALVSLADTLFPTWIPCDVWYQGDVLRLTGCSDNPNQLALLLLPAPFILADAASRLSVGRNRLFTVGTAGLGVVVGLATGSDALVAGTLLGLGVVLLLMLRSGQRWAIALTGLGAAVVAVGILSAIALHDDALGRLVNRAEEAADTNGQLVTRIELWTAGVKSVVDSSFAGWGPGAYSLLNEEGERQEAHNTFVDWTTNAGIVGLVALLGILAVALDALHRAERPWLFGSVVALMGFSFFHFVLRQPVFWIYALVPALSLAHASVTLHEQRGARINEPCAD